MQKRSLHRKSDTPNSETFPIIILQADHGPDSSFGIDGWNSPTEEMIKERMGILNAYLLPDKKEEYLYNFISPVNTFRMIFKIYFGADLDLLEDKSYFSNYETPYKFIPVTELNH